MLLEYLQNNSMSFEFEDLQVCPHTVSPNYHTIIKNPNLQKKHQIKIILKPKEDITMIYLDNLQIFILMRVIDEIDYFITFILDSRKEFIDEFSKKHQELRALMEVSSRIKKNKINQKSLSKTVLNLRDIQLIMPRHSRSDAFLKMEVKSGELTISKLV